MTWRVFSLLSKCENLGQRADQDDLWFAVFLAGMDFNALNHGADDVHGLGAHRLVC